MYSEVCSVIGTAARTGRLMGDLGKETANKDVMSEWIMKTVFRQS